MIMCSYKKIAITNREIFRKYHPGANSEEYAGYIRRLAEKLDYIILREKDLTEAEYEKFARLVLDGWKETQEKLILHTYVGAARRLGHRRIHLPMPEFVRWQKDLDDFAEKGVSTHSLDDALYAQEHGADYITASHIFATDCKRGLEPRGLDFLHEICEKVTIPVYALGGIHAANEASVIQAGAAGACRMSDYLKEI